MQRRSFTAACTLLGLIGASGSAQAAAPLHLQVYNPGSHSMFAVSSELVTGAREAILIDAQFQKKCLGKMEEVGKEGRTVLFVSHNISAIKMLCNRGILLADGEKILDSDINSTIYRYRTKRNVNYNF